MIVLWSTVETTKSKVELMNKEIGNLGEYQKMTTEAKELGGVDFYKEKYIELGRQHEEYNRDEQESNEFLVDLIVTVAVPLAIYSSTIIYEKIRNLKKDDVKEFQEKFTNNIENVREKTMTKAQSLKGKYLAKK